MLDHQKEAIESYFQCPTANGYGSRDAGFLAHACPENTLHICNEDIIIEIIDESGNPCQEGETGEIVVTHTQTPEFPFVRYRTGDRGSIRNKKCGCGREGLILEKVDGRTTDFITTPEGKAIHGLGLIYVLRELPYVKQFKITQDTPSDVRIDIVSDTEVNQEQREHIISNLAKVLGQNMSIAVEQLPAIPVEKNGKFRYIVNNTL